MTPNTTALEAWRAASRLAIPLEALAWERNRLQCPACGKYVEALYAVEQQGRVALRCWNDRSR